MMMLRRDFCAAAVRLAMPAAGAVSVGAVGGWSVGAHAQAAGKPEKSRIALAVGGKPSFYYLPLTIAEQRGYFKEEGLDVSISDFAGGAEALQALIGGSA